MRGRWGRGGMVGLGVALAVAGCGGEDRPAPRAATGPPAGAERVARAWADAVRRGDLDRAGASFRLPALLQVEAGGATTRVSEPAQLRAFHGGLPCGAQPESVRPRGRYLDVTFRLVDRRGSRCDSPGQLVATAFLVRGGRIVEWRRLPDPGGPPPSAPPDAPIV